MDKDKHPTERPARGTSRTEFLGAAGLTGAALVVGVGLRPVSAKAAVAGPAASEAARPPRGNNFALELGEVKAGFLRSADGGGAVAEVVTERLGGASFARKHIVAVTYEAITVEIGFSMSAAVYAWIAASWKAGVQRKDGAIITADFNFDAKSRRNFSNALITETTIPACDASGTGKGPNYITLSFVPELTEDAGASGKVAGATGQAQQKWIPSNFKLAIDGLDASKVSKIEAFTVMQDTATDDTGEGRDKTIEPGQIDFPNLVITLAEASAKSWFDWHKDFVIDGNSDEASEKNGSLTFLSPNRKTELAKIDFFNLGIFKIGPQKVESGKDQTTPVTAELYCQRMEFSYSAGKT